MEKRIIEIFGERFAIAFNSNGGLGYRPSDSKLDEETVRKHLSGELTIACYQLNEQDQIRWIGWDLDSPDNPEESRPYAEQLFNFLRGLALNPVCEFSGSKGYHVFLFLDKPLSASIGKEFGLWCKNQLNLPKYGKVKIEVFPKQTSLSGKKSGSAIKVPLGKHPITEKFSFFVIPPNWEDPADPTESLNKVSSSEFIQRILSIHQDSFQMLVDLISKVWTSGIRHELALYISGICFRNDWSQEDTEKLIQSVCEQTGDEDLSNRLACVRDTFQSKVEVKGIGGLMGILPYGIVRQIFTLINDYSQGSTNKWIRNLRNSRLSSPDKIVQATDFIWNHLSDCGKFVRDPDNNVYWLDQESHKLFNLLGIDWESCLNRKFDITTMDSFGRQINKSLYLRAWEFGEKIPVYSGSHWDGNLLWINWGDEIVYILDGQSIQTAFNGECGKIFSSRSSVKIPVQLNVSPEYCWQFLTDDLHYISTNDAPASPEEQKHLLRAWILSTFFEELFPTKPILTLLGSPGSGKTTAMRRILRVLESPDSDVLELVSDKQDAVRSSINTHKILIFDNMEKAPLWILTILEQIATGSQIEVRKLYHTIDVLIIKPKCFPVITAVNIPFPRETFFDRILPIEMERIQSPVPESFLQKGIIEHIGDIRGSLLHILNSVIQSLRRNSNISPQSVRLADFMSFVNRLQSCPFVDHQLAMNAMHAMKSRQRSLLLQSSPFIEILSYWIETFPEDAKQWHSLRELYETLSTLARTKKINWSWNSIQAFSPHFHFLQSSLEREFGMESQFRYHASAKRSVFVFRFLPEGQEDT